MNRVTNKISIPVRGMDVHLTREGWDRLRGQAPVPATAEDMTDHALGELEAMADAVRVMSSDALVDAYRRAERERVETDVLAAEIKRRGLDT